MRKISAILFIVAACGSDSSTKPDAPPVTPDVAVVPDAAPDAFVRVPDLSCLGNTPPSNAPATVKLSGVASDINLTTRMPEPVKDADVGAYRNNMKLTGATTDAQGAFTLTVDNPSTLPIEGHIRAAKDGHRSLRLYPATPITADLANAPLLLLSDDNFEFVRRYIAMKAQDAGNGTVGLLVLDCTNQPVEGATISVKQGDVELATPLRTWEATALQAGTYLIFDVPPGETTVTATYNGMAFLGHDIGVVMATTSTTAVRPGY
ncbi:MAG: carboxypeptidase-like regulatory domain-containing protein [Kofleriaceae bacterium]